ncbi:hypothetical protein NPIL_73551 [Nephila pilipes]|uniref:Uncharacterized protein n=1 Tax=Nephila pilipes TaxID=299642 RepID=A0A8X6KMQ3_NEPPI|nr:hypothetical protein NPIL_73551 [Nephila pilipes]
MHPSRRTLYPFQSLDSSSKKRMDSKLPLLLIPTLPSAFKSPSLCLSADSICCRFSFPSLSHPRHSTLNVLRDCLLKFTAHPSYSNFDWYPPHPYFPTTQSSCCLSRCLGIACTCSAVMFFTFTEQERPQLAVGTLLKAYPRTN